MIEGLRVRELPSRSHVRGYTVDLWQGEEAPPASYARLHHVFPGCVEAWWVREITPERVVCLRGMIKLVVFDRREGSPTREEVVEVYLGEYRFREVEIPPGVLLGWKAVGHEPALVLRYAEAAEEGRRLSPEEAGVPYDWEIVMR
ncbi:dTDP-4-dehydrorhamnose 3,5-epimerase family protein [Candidatus Solincola tengchongensis]|uniref:dTDP-4-dehydrorhamnose 3,5-epimerase family protein n=1 Tax=Candidatus Solincola tengchongensis TaxID=2900693 RepID=UPI002579BF89|nr:dTDP-4-dehydrorhamnose 3,5-epimerase family protein [Candidatus Solincola tengchongensis]